MRRFLGRARFAQPLGVFLYRIGLAYLLFLIARCLFYLFNTSFFPDLTAAQWARIWYGGLRFDTAAVLYLNALFILLSLLPLRLRAGRHYQRLVDATWYFPNALGIMAGLADCVYFPMTLKRTTADFVTEFAHERPATLLHLLVEFWYVTLLAAALIALFVWLYRRLRPTWSAPLEHLAGWRYYLLHTAVLLLAIFLVIGGFRGFNFSRFLRPLAIGHANAYVDKLEHRPLVLNTPYCILRTIGKKSIPHYPFFPSDNEAESILQPERTALPTAPHFGALRGRNVMIIIVESFARQYIGSLNKALPDYRGYTPCFDSLAEKGYCFEQAFANGRISIDAMPALLASLPKLNEHFVTSAYSLNDIHGLGTLLAQEGYATQFFHGGTNGTMNFDAFVRQAGYERYFGRTEYANDADFDGVWGIWDDRFLLRSVGELSSMPQPFLGTLFTVTSHSPYQLPKEFVGRFPDEGEPMVKCIGYTDYALGAFFRRAAQEPWFENTLFVITADDASGYLLEQYRTPVLRFAVPMLLYAPGSDLRGRDTTTVVQHADLLPTLLNLLGYEKPFVSFGNNMLDPHVPHFAFSDYDGLFQLVEGEYVLQHDGLHPVGLYHFATDNTLQNNLLNDPTAADRLTQMRRRLEALLQSYSARMKGNRLVPHTEVLSDSPHGTR